MNAVQFLIADIVQTVGPVVPVAQAGEQADGGNGRHGQRQHDPPENGHLTGTVNLRGLQQCIGHIVGVIVFHQNHIEGVHQIVGNQQCKNGIFNVEDLGPHDVGGNDTTVEQHGEKYKE